MNRPIQIRESSGRIVSTGGARVRVSEAAKTPPAAKGSASDTDRKLREVMINLGLSPSEADSAVVGRNGSRAREAVKNVAGLTSRAFAWVPDENDPSTWRLQICRTDYPGMTWEPDQELVQAAVKVIPEPGAFGRMDIPDADLPAVKSTLRSAWIAAGLDVTAMPEVLSEVDLVNALRGWGLTEAEATRGARGRNERNGGRA
jgi:hypothetical protein